jgi:HlyD family secretion protein
MKQLTWLFTVGMLLSCSHQVREADAYGNFEAEEIIVSAEIAGNLLEYIPDDGLQVTAGQYLGCIDSMALVLKKEQILAQKQSVRKRIISAQAELAVLQEQKVVQLREKTRLENLLRDGAATQKQMDDMNGALDILDKRILSMQTQVNTIGAELFVLDTQRDQVNDQLHRCIIKAPIDGTILESYVENHEMVVPGKALFKVADLGTMKLKVWVSGAQLTRVRIGASCTARIDEGDKGYKDYTGTVSYVSSKAEFTPKIIQTKEERVTLVYAVTIKVPNDGSIKSGMPGEAIF